MWSWLVSLQKVNIYFLIHKIWSSLHCMQMIRLQAWLFQARIWIKAKITWKTQLKYSLLDNQFIIQCSQWVSYICMAIIILRGLLSMKRSATYFAITNSPQHRAWVHERQRFFHFQYSKLNSPCFDGFICLGCANRLSIFQCRSWKRRVDKIVKPNPIVGFNML